MRNGRFTRRFYLLLVMSLLTIVRPAHPQDFLSCRAPARGLMRDPGSPASSMERATGPVQFYVSHSHSNRFVAGRDAALEGLQESTKVCPERISAARVVPAPGHSGPSFIAPSPRGPSVTQKSHPSDAIRQILRALVGDDSIASVGLVPAVVIERSPAINAFARNSTEVVLTAPLLQSVSDHSELAFVIAHELGHLALHHSVNEGERAELEADSLALELVKRAGFNPCAGPTVLKRLASLAARPLPSIPARLRALDRKTRVWCGS